MASVDIPRTALDHARLRWLEVDGAIVHVQTLAHLPVRQRPLARCPVCEKPVTLKLGRILVPHYAHRPEDDCASSSGESALHLNTKFHLYDVLRRTATLSVVERCSGGRFGWCSNSRGSVWQRDWDEVMVEKGLGSVRPDLLLLRSGSPIAAVEVFATHAVDEAKRGVLASLGIPWIEVQAQPALYEGEGWNGVEPLAVRDRHPSQETWHCREHLEEVERMRRAALCRTLRVRIVDYFFLGGGFYRDVFLISAYIPDGRKAALVWAHCIDTNKFQLTDNNPTRERTLPRLAKGVEAWLEAKRRCGVIVDSPMGWMRPDWLQSPQLLDFQQYPARYRWSPGKREWFLGPYMRDVRWATGRVLAPGRRPSWWPRFPLDLRELTFPR